MFLREFVPESLKDAWRTEFEQLRQDSMTVSEGYVSHPVHSAFLASSSITNTPRPQAPNYAPPLTSAPPTQGAFSGQSTRSSPSQPRPPRPYFECGDTRHMVRDCPRLRKGAPPLTTQALRMPPGPQASQSMVITPDATPPAQLARGEGRASRGRPRRGGQARYYALPARTVAVASNSVITSIVLAQHMVEKGCNAYLAFVRDVSVDTPTVESVPIVRDYLDVFLMDLPVSSEGINVDPKKIDAVQSWPKPSSAMEIRSFLGLARYYCRFVEGFLVYCNAYDKIDQKGALFRECHYDDSHLLILKDTVQYGDAKEVTIGDDAILRIQRKFNAVWVIVDRLTKSAHFIPVVTTDSSEQQTQVYIREIIRLHGIPVSIISDRGTKFTSRFWRAVHHEFGTRVELSTAFHPQMDGQSERTIQIYEEMLCVCVMEFGGSWDQFLPLAEFAYNNSYQ
ncbi:uncharacterized protein [Nicotiana tomentosiformis]|uniref:uncharacterized protein n=1 Tax=Nicotiana tomentosiformis TaxID=4098 RepID=UPI00388CC45A